MLLRTLAFSSVLVSSANFLLPAETAHEEHATQLPVRKVVLYKNGVGYFEHEGHVTNAEAVSVDFTSAQLNDVLQSLTALDLGGGRITGVNYNSTSPLEQQLKTIPLGLNEAPSTADLFAALRGTRVEISGAGVGLVSGRLLNLEISSEQKESATIEHRRLTVVSDTGAVRLVELTPSLTVRVLDGSLQRELGHYLDLLASTHNQQMRHLTLQTQGTGSRDVRVSYISEVPVWKSTYRIVFPKATQSGDASTAILQGWAVVDNTVGSDWDNVQLSLVAGAPQSFVQSLSQPYYTRRPEIGLPESAMLTPQTHEGTMVDSTAASQVGSVSESETTNGAHLPQALARRDSIGQHGNASSITGPGGAMGGGVVGGFLGGIGTGTAGGVYHSIDTPIVQDESGSTNTSGFDDYFEYALAQPITIHKNESALVPVLQTNVQAERVTLWSWAQPQPLRALWLTNTSNLTLDRGSFSIFENGEFAGEGLLDPIHANEKRLLSYAVDQAVQVKITGLLNSQRLHHVVVHDGVLIEQNNEINERTYTVHNAASEPRNVIVEHPVRDGWKLTSEVNPVETSASSYRFRVIAQPNETVSLHVGEAHTFSTRYVLTSITDDQMQLLIKGGLGDTTGNVQVKQALQPVFEAKAQLNDLDRQIQLKQGEITRITDDQRRLHDNLAGLKDTSEERQLAKRYAGEMNADEDQLQALRGQLADLDRQHTAAQLKLSETIHSLNLDLDVTNG